jgi:hypothetical protein
MIPYRPNPALKDVFGGGVNPNGKPFLFTVTEPNSLNPLHNTVLALHCNPESVTETYTKSKSEVATYGGFIEWHWTDDLDNVSASGSSGAFFHNEYGLVGTSKRHETIAYERFRSLLDIFRMNGVVYDGAGKPMIRGRVVMIFDRGIFYGHFNSFDVDESVDNPFSFKLSWDFKVEKVINFFQKSTI